MKVYQVEPLNGLICDARDKEFLSNEKFSGRPFPDDWRSSGMLFESGSGPQVDFCGFGGKAMVCSHRVRLFVAPLEDEGEFFPVRISGLKGKFYIYNVTHCASHLDAKKTLWNTRVPRGQPGAIKRPAFHADRFGEDCVFKIPEDGATSIYCLERTGDPRHESLRSLVKRHGLTGLKFKLVWSEKRPSNAAGKQRPKRR